MTQEPITPIPHSGIVSVEELHRYMNKPSWNNDQRISVAETLAGVQQDLENYLNRPLEPVQIRQTVVSDLQGYVNLSITPVLKVISFKSLDLKWDGSAMYTPVEVPPVMERDPLVDVHGRLLERYRPGQGDPFIIPGGADIGSVGVPYLIEYVAGYNGYVNAGLKSAIKRVAAREVRPNNETSVNLRDGQAGALQDPDDRPRGWTDEEQQNWDRLRRRVIA